MSANADGYIRYWPTTYFSTAGNISCVDYYWGGASPSLTGSNSDNIQRAVRVYVEHSHNYEHIHYINSDGGNESRPNNYTYVVWKRIS